MPPIFGSFKQIFVSMWVVCTVIGITQNLSAVRVYHGSTEISECQKNNAKAVRRSVEAPKMGVFKIPSFKKMFEIKVNIRYTLKFNFIFFLRCRGYSRKSGTPRASLDLKKRQMAKVRVQNSQFTLSRKYELLCGILLATGAFVQRNPCF